MEQPLFISAEQNTDFNFSHVVLVKNGEASYALSHPNAIGEVHAYLNHCQNIETYLSYVIEHAKNEGAKTMELSFLHQDNDHASNITQLLEAHGFVSNDTLPNFQQYQSDDERRFICNIYEEEKKINITNRTPGDIMSYKTDTEYAMSLQNALRNNESLIVFQNISFNFINRMAPEGKELLPFLHFYVSQSLSTDVFEISVENVVNGKLNFFLRLNSNSPRSLWNAKLNIDCFDELPNKYGVYCVNQAGSAMIPLSVMMDKSKVSNKNISSIRVNLRIPTLPDVQKGELILKIDPGSVVLHNINNIEEIDEQIERGIELVSKFGSYAKDSIPTVEISSMISDYLKETFMRFQKMKPTWDVIKRIHAFTYVSRIGLTPAQVYHMLQIHRNDPLPQYSMQTWLNFIKIALRRDGNLTLDQFRNGKYPKEFKNADEFSSYIMAMCLTEYVNACKYITDKIDRNDRTVDNKWKEDLVELIESFDQVSVRDCGDCEDFGMMMMYQSFILKHIFRELKKQKQSSEFVDDALWRVGYARSLFYVFANLSGVSSMTLNGDYGQLKNMGAHEYLVLIPRSYYYSMTILTKPLLLNGLVQESFINRLIPEKDKKIGRTVRVLVCEGTGFLRPDGRGTDEFEVEREILSNFSSTSSWAFKDAHKMFYYDMKGSKFYQTNSSLFTHEWFYRGIPIGEFTMGYLRDIKHPENIESWTYGTRFTEMINRAENVHLIAQPELPSKLYNIIKLMIEDLHPMRPLMPPNPEPVLQKDKETQLLIKTVGKNAIKSPLEDSAIVDFYVRFDQMTKERVEAFINATKSISSSAWIDVVEESMCLDRTGKENFGGYHLFFHIPKQSDLQITY